MDPITLEVWSDYLCPWCFNATVRLEQIEAEYAPRVRLVWRSYLLRPNPAPRGDLGRFRDYTQSWLRPAAEPDSGTFRTWSANVGPPSHSVPAHQVAKAAERVSEPAFRRMHRRLLEAYFAENRDVSDPVTLRELWDELALPAGAFDAREAPELLEQILDEHHAAGEGGATGVPAVRLVGNPAVIVGAHPLALYRRWMDRLLG